MKVTYKRLLSIALMLVMVLSMVPATSLVANAAGANYCPHCEKDVTWTATAEIPTAAGHYRLSDNITVTNETNVGDDIVIDLAGKTIEARGQVRVFFVELGTLSVKDSVGGGKIKGGNVVEAQNRTGGTVLISAAGTFNLYSGTITGGHALRGGNIFSTGTVNIYGGAINEGQVSKGSASGTMGGNICNYTGGRMNIYGGTIDANTVEKKNLTNSNITNYCGADGYLNIYGGTITDPRPDSKGIQASEGPMNVYGGTIISTIGWHTVKDVTIYGGTIAGQDPTDLMASCAYKQKVNDTTYMVMHTDACTNNCEIVMAKVGTKTYNKLSDALAAAKANKATVVMAANCKVGNLEVTDATLDLAGNILLADGVDATKGNIIDSTNGKGLLNCADAATAVKLSATNKNLPFAVDGGYTFEEVKIMQRLRNDSANEAVYKFYFSKSDSATQLKEALEAGKASVKIVINYDGAEKPAEFKIDAADVKTYVANWSKNVFTLTLTGVEGKANLTCGVVVTANGVDCAIAAATVTK